MTNNAFHKGELRLQDEMGVRKKMAVAAKFMMRDFMPDQHREFFEGLEYIFLGTIDEKGLPQAAILTGPLGFITSPEPAKLVIKIPDLRNKPFLGNLTPGAYVGVLGLDLSNRRRNRMHGRVSAMDSDIITITVVQSYGNCPKYISVRDIAQRDVPVQNKTTENDVLSGEDMALITSADTFFIASYVNNGSDAPFEGVDMSHRGGEPGFVSLDNASHITIPDYKGNNIFNTLGNLLVNPNAALLFIDFNTGEQLHINGQAELINTPEENAKYPGAQRVLRIKIGRVQRAKAAVGLRWKFIEGSPFNPALTP